MSGPRRLSLALLLTSAVLGRAGADALAANLKAFKTVCVSGDYAEQDKENAAILDKLLQRLADALDAAGIEVAPDCKLADALGGGTQLNVYYTFLTTQSGQIYDAALEGWLAKEGRSSDVTVWRDSYFGAMDAGTGAIQAADLLDELLQGFIKAWDSVH